MKHRATVAFLVREKEVLLARKKKKLAKGLWNGYGGFEEEGDQSIDHTAIREMEEEIGVSASIDALEKIGIVTYSNKNEEGRLKEVEVHFYKVHTWDGAPRASEEMDSPTWFSLDGLPVEEMMPTDRTWIPEALKENTYYLGTVLHGENKEVLRADFTVVPGF